MIGGLPKFEKIVILAFFWPKLAFFQTLKAPQAKIHRSLVLKQVNSIRRGFNLKIRMICFEINEQILN